MYNQFIPPDGFRPVSPPPGTPPKDDPPPKGRSPLSALLSSLLGKGGNVGGTPVGRPVWPVCWIVLGWGSWITGICCCCLS